jgi:hypothetical protein
MDRLTGTCTIQIIIIALTGFITKGITNEEESHHVTFYNIRPQDVLPNDVINIGGAVPWPTLKVHFM